MHRVARAMLKRSCVTRYLTNRLLGGCSVQALQGVVHIMASHACYAAVTLTAHIRGWRSSSSSSSSCSSSSSSSACVACLRLHHAHVQQLSFRKFRIAQRAMFCPAGGRLLSSSSMPVAAVEAAPSQPVSASARTRTEDHAPQRPATLRGVHWLQQNLCHTRCKPLCVAIQCIYLVCSPCTCTARSMPIKCVTRWHMKCVQVPSLTVM